MEPVKILVIGAGDRGTNYATYAEKYPEKANVVGVAEPRDFYRETFSRKHNIPATNASPEWETLVERDKFADAVFITTQDSLHKDPAIAFANKGYHILLEKPIAPNEEDCRQITDSFTMTAFNEAVYRKTYIFGTRGELFCDGKIIRHYDFLTDKTRIITPDIPKYEFMDGHGGGDYELIKTFIEAVAENDPNKIRSGPQETLDSHLLVFAAEKSRLENKVVNL